MDALVFLFDWIQKAERRPFRAMHVHEEVNGFAALLSMHGPIGLRHTLDLEVDAKASSLSDIFGDGCIDQRPELEDFSVVDIAKKLAPLFVAEDQADINVAKVRSFQDRADHITVVFTEGLRHKVADLPQRKDF